MYSKRLSSEQIRAEIAARQADNAERAARIARLHEELPGGRGLRLREATRREITKAELDIEQLEQQLVTQLEREKAAELGLSTGKRATQLRLAKEKGRCICCLKPTSLKPSGEPYAKCDAHRKQKGKREALLAAEQKAAAFTPVLIRPRR